MSKGWVTFLSSNVAHLWKLRGNTETATLDNKVPWCLRETFICLKPQGQEVITLPPFGRVLCSHCLGSDKRPPSQTRTFTAQTNYWTGSSCIHCGLCRHTCPAFYQLLIHEMAITERPRHKGERGRWCSMMLSVLHREQATNISATLRACSPLCCCRLEEPDVSLSSRLRATTAIFCLLLLLEQASTQGTSLHWYCCHITQHHFLISP